MKKKILSALAAVTVLSGALVISSPSASAAELPNDGISVVAEENTQTYRVNSYYRMIPQEIVDMGEFEYGGLHYTASSTGYFDVTEASDPSKEKVLILNYVGNKGKITYSNSIDWSKYTNLEDVIVTGNSLNFATNILAQLPSGVNLYLGGACNLGTILPSTFKNVYVYATYLNGFNDLDSDGFTSYINSSSVEHIYINQFYEMNCNPSAFDNLNLTNGFSEPLKTEVCNEWKYPEEVFYVLGDFIPNGKVFESDGYYSVSTNSDITSSGSLTYNLESISEDVIDLDATSISSGAMIPFDQEFRKIYMPQNKDYHFERTVCDELIIRPYSGSDALNITNFNGVKALRFIKSVSNFQITTDTLPTGSKLEKIYIPESLKDKFSAITSRSDLAPLVEYFDLNTYVAPTNAYLSNDGNIYCVKNSNYTIEQMEQAKTLLQLMGLEVNAETVIDEMLAYYEVPLMDYSKYEPVYSARKFDTIVVPKNMDATKVLEGFEFLVTLNHGYMADGDSTITADTTNYQVGYNATLPITITLPDNRIINKDIIVKTMNVEGNIGYILDGNDVYVVTNPTTELKSLASLMAPLMENHLMESQVEYDQSPLLDSASYGYLAGNAYTATLSSGKAKVVVSDVELVETPQAPNVGNTNNGDQTNDNTNQEQSNVVFKEITNIYTPETVDGSRLMSTIRYILCTVDGEPYEVPGFAIGTSQGRTNKEDYTFNAWTRIENTYVYDKDISVKIMDFNYDMGFVMFGDGDIAVVFNANKDYTNEQIEEAIKAFLTAHSLNAESFEMTKKSVNETKTYESSYDQGTVYIINSGVNVGFSSSNQAVDQTEVKQGFVALTEVMYTKDFTKEEVLRALGKNILLKDGELYTEEYEIDYTTKEDSNWVDVVFKSGETILLKTSIKLELIESDYSYIFARAFQFDYGYLLMDKQATAPEYTLNDVMLDVVPRFRGLLKPFETEATIDFTKTTTADVDGIYHVGNGSYYEYEFNVEVANIDHLVRTNDVLVDGVEPVGETVSDKLNDFFDDFKVKFEENKAFKTATIALGTITGILLIWGIWAIISKFFKWLRR